VRTVGVKAVMLATVKVGPLGFESVYTMVRMLVVRSEWLLGHTLE
jgi:hypothetical protein